jgi:hypothetical protein
MDEPEIIVTNASILTMDPARPRAEAIALAGGRIAALGGRRAVEALAGATTTVIDAGGRSVLPGFVESHCHLFPGAIELDQLHLGERRDLGLVTEEIRAHAAARPEAPLLVVQGGHHALFSEHSAPTRAHLDAILPDRPLALVAFDHHTVWANTAALEAAGLIGGAHLPPGNEVVMGADGRASGELREGEAFAPVMALSPAETRAWTGLRTGRDPEPAPGPAERAIDRAVLERGLGHLARHGITSFHNMDGNPYTLELLGEIEAAGALSARARVPFHFKPFMEIGALDTAMEMAARCNGGMLASGFVKLFMDGVLDGFTAVMLEDYADRPGWRGEALFSAERFAEIATEIDRRGLQIAVHAIGDGAVRTVLDGYAAAHAANGARDSRHRIEHIEAIAAADIQRLAELGVVASMQPPHPPGVMGLPLEPTVSRLGRGRWATAYPWAALVDAGAPLAFSSDWPVSDVNPLRGIHAALTRIPWAEDMPDQRIGLMATLSAYTAGGAYAGFAEASVGRLAPDMQGDLVMLSDDIEAVEVDAIAGMRVALTLCAGRITNRAKGLA